MNRLLFLLPVLFMACGTQPKTANGTIQAAEEELAAKMPEEEELAAEKPVEEEQAEDKPAEIAIVAPPAAHTSSRLEDESYEEVFMEVKAFIERLNQIIQSKDYNKWRDVLSEERYNEISSPEFLANVSNSDAMKNRRIAVNTVNDYFLNVVVPSRANSKVDKIEILDNNRVKAFYENTKKETTELVYELIKNGNSWKILR